MSNTPQPTVLAELIKELTLDMKCLSGDLDTDYNKGVTVCIREVIDKIKSKLPREREQMEEIGVYCYNQGTEDQYHGEYRHKFSDYFTKNYVQE